MEYVVAYEEVPLFTSLVGEKITYYCTLVCFTVFCPT